MVERPIRIAVCGAGAPDADGLDEAVEVGRELARAGAVLLCGGLDGVMAAAAAGAEEEGGLTIGILPGRDDRDANAHIRIPLATGMGEMRNALLVRAAEAVIAIGGEWGTLSEVALAMKMGVPVVLLMPGLTAGLGLEQVRTAPEAVRLALRHARGGRGS